jgi:predicted RNase H-like HicB family nuclease
MTYAILVEKVPSGQVLTGLYYAHVPALGLTTHAHGIEGARAAAEDLIKLWLAEKKAAGETIDLPSVQRSIFPKVPYKARLPRRSLGGGG